MFDLIIRGGDVVTPEGVVRCDVAVASETIAAIATPGALPADSAKQLIDATGRIVIPGGIDPHVHLHHVWIKPDGTPLVTAGPEQVGRAALFGGTTTFIDFAYWRDGVSALQAIETRDKDFAGKSHVIGPTTSCCPPSRRPNSPASSLRRSRPATRRSRYSPPIFFPRAAAAWSTSAISGRRSRFWRRRAGLASFMQKTTTSSCTCTPSSSATGGWATSISPKSTISYRKT